MRDLKSNQKLNFVLGQALVASGTKLTTKLTISDAKEFI